MIGTGTDSKSDAWLTQERSALVLDLRRDLIALREKHGADTPIGRRCSNLIEQLENLKDATGERRKHLEKSIAKSVAELAKLSN